VNKNAKELTRRLEENLSKAYDKTYVSLSKTKRLLKNNLALSYKSHTEVVSNKLSERNISKRKLFIRLFIQHTKDKRCKNMLSIDETAWYPG